MTENQALSSDRFEIVLSSWEARMSLWIETPCVREKVGGKVILGFQNTHWSLDQARWQSDSVVELRLRKYPGSHQPTQVIVTVDCVAMTGNISGKTVPAHEIEATLDRQLTWPTPAPEEATGIPGLFQRLHRMWREKFQKKGTEELSV